MNKKFSAEQLALIADSSKYTAQLDKRVTLALGTRKLKVEVKRHTYIYSPPGLGKTFAVQRCADEHGIEMIKIQGAASLNAIVTQLACAVFLKKDGPINVWIDDCDSIFTHLEGLNVMKGALDEDRNALAWNKNLTIQIDNYLKSTSKNDHIKGNALRAFQETGSVGVVVPTDRMRFIVTSNRALCAPSMPLTNAKKVHEAAIRDRVNYYAIDLTPKQSWGWSANMLLASDMLGLTKRQKEILLCWMYAYWDRLPGNSLRTVKDYAAAMVNSPSDYFDEWNSTLTSEAEVA